MVLPAMLLASKLPWQPSTLSGFKPGRQIFRGHQGHAVAALGKFGPDKRYPRKRGLEPRGPRANLDGEPATGCETGNGALDAT